MAILRSSDGKFYDVADEELDGKLIPAEHVKERLGEVGSASAAGGPEAAEAEGDVEAHGWCWRRNWFRNCWRRNCWRNSCRPY